MKKILALMLALVMVLCFAACGERGETPSGSNTDNPGTSETDKPSNNDNKDKTLEEKAAEIASGFGTYNGKSVTWRVLTIDATNKKALLITQNCLAEVLFHNTEPTEELTWESSDLRKWLGGEFYNSVFTDEQKGKILETTNPADTNSESGAKGGNDTADKVFILSASEMTRYFTDDADMASPLNGEPVAYWTRTPGDSTQGYVCTYAGSSGGLYMTGNWATSTEVAVRPAIWVNLDDGTANNNDNTQTEQPGNTNTDTPAGEVTDFKVGIEGVPAEWQKGIGKELYGMEVSAGGSDFTTGYLQKFGNVSADDYAKLIAYFDTLSYTEKLEGVYNCSWGQLQIGHNAAGSEMTITWYVN